MLKICVTGAAGNISQCLIPMLFNGSVFHETKVFLSLLDIEAVKKKLNGIKLEILDCNYPTLISVEAYVSAKEAFKDCDIIIFLGGFPRKEGMERHDLLALNGKIYMEQAEALSVAKENVKCIVVANPCNSNVKILYERVKKLNLKIPKENFTCLSRLDHNRANTIYRQATGKIINAFVWGNHSKTCVPDTIDENIVFDDELMEKVQLRGAMIIKEKGFSSTFSAAQSVCQHLKDWCYGSSQIVSMGILSNGEYGIAEGIFFSFPIKCTGNWKYEIVRDIKINEKIKEKINLSVKELLDEAKEISSLL